MLRKIIKIPSFALSYLKRSTSNNLRSPINHIAFFSAKNYDLEHFKLINSQFPTTDQHVLEFYSEVLNKDTALSASGLGTVCVFVNDKINEVCLKVLKNVGVSLIALRCTGFKNIDLKAAKDHNIKIVRVPAYSPYAVAEHAFVLALSINRKIPKASNRTRENNFKLDGMKGFDFFGKTVGIIGTGKIGTVFADICKGFGMNIIY